MCKLFTSDLLGLERRVRCKLLQGHTRIFSLHSWYSFKFSETILSIYFYSFIDKILRPTLYNIFRRTLIFSIFTFYAHYYFGILGKDLSFISPYRVLSFMFSYNGHSSKICMIMFWIKLYILNYQVLYIIRSCIFRCSQKSNKLYGPKFLMPALSHLH
jgi:hypothetical protein